MKVLLLKDVFKLGQGGDVKKVADGYARNYLIPRGLAVPATTSAVKQAGRLRAAAASLREQENREKAGLAERVGQLRLTFPARASEQGRLYGSITHQMIVDAIAAECGEKIDRRSVVAPPLKELGEFRVPIRLTADLIPEITVVVYPEGEEPPAQLLAEPDALDPKANVQAAAADEATDVVTDVTSHPAEEPAA